MSVYECPECGYQYDETKGEPHEGYAPGTLWEAIPATFCCPSCSVRDKEDFYLVDEEL